MSNIRKDRGKNTTDFSEIQMNTKECLENVFTQIQKKHIYSYAHATYQN